MNEIDKQTKEKLAQELQLEHKQVLSVIRKGMTNAITCKDIQTLTGLSSVRIRQIVRDLIIKYGKVIGASNRTGMQGFYIPDGPNEELAAILNLRSRRVLIVAREKALVNNIAAKHQFNLFEDFNDDDYEDVAPIL